MTRIVIAAGFTVGAALMPGLAAAEEGGSGHYLPGSIASFIDSVPPSETFIVRFNGINYTGSLGVTERLPFGGVAAGGPSASVWGAGLTFLWRPPIDLGARWSYAVSTTIPFLDSKVTANVNAAIGPLSKSISRTSEVSGLGDIVLMPLMVNYNVDPDFNVNGRVAFYAPTGSYQVGRLSNLGKNFWTIEPTLGLVYFGQKNGIEASAYFGIDFNTTNPATQYKSGTQFHVDGTLAQHFPLMGGIAGVGISAFDYQQVTGDSGAGATFGAFEGKTVGLGPVASFITKIGGDDTIWEIKWLHEVQTQNRLQGNIAWLKAVLEF